MTELHEAPPREQKGRDTFARFRAQLMAAAYASLKILDGKGVDRVYSDYHDDFVVRHNANGKHSYHFFQVKTKAQKKYQWSLNDTWGLTKKHKKPRPLETEVIGKVRNSFFGNLLLHCINFGPSCKESTLLTNVHFDDDVEELIGSLQGKCTSDRAELIKVNFNAVFPSTPPYVEDAIANYLSRLSIEPDVSYADPNGSDFPIRAREAIHKYSEIDLDHDEASEIALSCVNLFFNKSFQQVLHTVTEAQLDEIAGVGLDELLKVLSISKDAYKILADGGDEKALKSASIIQRRLEKCGAASNIIEFCSQQKVAWDTWIRDKRHDMAELDFNFLQQDIHQVVRDWNGSNWDWLRDKLDGLAGKWKTKPIGTTVTSELLLGGVFSMLVKSEML
ncbi:MAG: DUF4297 domain-containing protein [Sulfuritalea sp.]|jgi:hypothetical protein|nr:DUF4297 domain-containing protein [Sulfuritalea sp.]